MSASDEFYAALTAAGAVQCPVCRDYVTPAHTHESDSAPVEPEPAPKPLPTKLTVVRGGKTKGAGGHAPAPGAVNLERR